MATSCATSVGLMAHEVADFAERQAVGLCLLDKADAVDRPAVVFAKPAARSSRAWQEALTLVVPQRVACQTARRRQFANSHRSFRSEHAAPVTTIRIRSTAAVRSPRQHAPFGLRISQAHRAAAMWARTRATAWDAPVRPISAAMSPSFSPKQ